MHRQRWYWPPGSRLGFAEGLLAQDVAVVAAGTQVDALLLHVPLHGLRTAAAIGVQALHAAGELVGGKYVGGAIGAD